MLPFVFASQYDILSFEEWLCYTEKYRIEIDSHMYNECRLALNMFCVQVCKCIVSSRYNFKQVIGIAEETERDSWGGNVNQKSLF